MSTLAIGQVWRTKDKGEDWVITATHPDARGAYYVELLDEDGARTGVTDALFGGEIQSCAERACPAAHDSEEDSR